MRPADKAMLDAIVADTYAKTHAARAQAFAKFVYEKGHRARYEEWDEDGDRPRVSKLWTTIGREKYGKAFTQPFMELVKAGDEEPEEA